MKMSRWSKAATSRRWSDRSMKLPNTSPDMSPIPTAVDGRSAVAPTLDHEPALGPGGHDQRVLEDLGPHQAQHLAAVVVRTLAATDAPACHRAPAQVDTFDLRSVDEDLAVGDGAAGA